MTLSIERCARFSLEVRWRDTGESWRARVRGAGLAEPLIFESPLALLEWLESKVCAHSNPTNLP